MSWIIFNSLIKIDPLNFPSQIYFEQRKADRAFYEQQAFRQAAGTNIMGAITGMQDDALSLLNSAADLGTSVPPPTKKQ